MRIRLNIVSQTSAMMTRDEMNAALRSRFVPALRTRGFRGSLPHFRRIGPSSVDLLTVQFDRHGGGFIVEIARCDLEGTTTHWGLHIPASKVTAHDVNRRHRLGCPGPGQDGHWFRFDDGSRADVVADDLVARLPEADAWWSAG